jgi:hypothetical protein
MCEAGVNKSVRVNGRRGVALLKINLVHGDGGIIVNSDLGRFRQSPQNFQ